MDEVLNRLSPQVDVMIINANGDPARFSSYTLPCVPDSMSGHLGPLAGVLAGLEYARENGFGWIASVAADTPFSLKISFLGQEPPRMNTMPPWSWLQVSILRDLSGCATQHLAYGTCP